MPVTNLMSPLATQGELTGEEGQGRGRMWVSRGRRVKRRKERRGKSGRRKGSRGSRRKGDEEENGEEASAL